MGELSPDKLAGATIGDLLTILDETQSTTQIHPDLAAYEADLQNLRELRNAIAHYNPLVHYMSNDVTSDWTAGELFSAHRLLRDIVNS